MLYDLDEIDCPDCNGTGYDYGYGQCDRCAGTGSIDIDNASYSERASFFSKLGKDDD